VATKTIAATDNVNEILFLLFLSLLMLFIDIILSGFFRESQQLFLNFFQVFFGKAAQPQLTIFILGNSITNTFPFKMLVIFFGLN
jgi:uncharacterized membrane protein